ncbi:ADP-ribosylation factor-like protein 13B [Uranotaenia lowii]|uniref:ADP-ribosylation factor-like protein 13B n=1 Tax=Uranotaenia lowii TaxID=190385 RepID=UPI00247B0B65|nr:ADP-ribosylation factor-like protein 13B [Uranotaenia lowii]
MGNFLKRCFTQPRSSERPVGLLIVGLQNSGKTEIAYKIIGENRNEYLQTKGCRIYNTIIADVVIQLTEVGGAEEFRDIWKYYFLDMYGIIFVIDTSSIDNICQSLKVFENLMAHDFLIGKPFLIIANKQDLSGSVDSIDICEYLNVEFLANKYRNPCMIEACGNWPEDANEYDGLEFGINWLVKTITSNKQFLTNRINFHRVMLEHSSKLFESHRPCTSVRRKNSRFSFRDKRPKTAPSAIIYQNLLVDNDNNYLAKRNSTVLSLKKSGRSQSTNVGSNEATFNSSHTNTEGLSIVEEITESIAPRNNEIESKVIITDQPNEDITVEDLSLTLQSNMSVNKTANGVA